MSVTSPHMPVDEGIVTTAKQFSDGLTLELTDEEITRALRITLPIKNKWQNIFRSRFRDTQFTVEEAMKLVDQFEAELVEELATKANLIATIDASPVFEGEPLVIEFVGALDSHVSATYGLDHEKKEWEVKRAKSKDQAFLGVDTLDN